MDFEQEQALTPCPFCGSDMSAFAGMTPEAFAKGSQGYAVECDCSAVGPFVPTMGGAIEAWNRRSGDYLRGLSEGLRLFTNTGVGSLQRRIIELGGSIAGETDYR